MADHVKNIGAANRGEAAAAARAVFECRVIVGRHLKKSDAGRNIVEEALDAELYVLEMKLCGEVDRLKQSEHDDG